MQTMLPFDLLASGCESLISCDGQIYLGCEQCAREARLHYSWLVDPAAFPHWVCASCGSEVNSFVRHLDHGAYRCLDCHNRFESATAGFEDLACGICGSAALELLATEILPPFPNTFDQIAPPKTQPWGLSVVEDLEHMQNELGLSRHSLDFPSHLLLNVRFCERLRLANNYPPSPGDFPILNFEANLFLEHCKRTDTLETGLNALELFEHLVARPGHDENGDNVIALTCDALLVRFSENELALAGRTTLRADAVRHARAAVAAAEKEASSDVDASSSLASAEVVLSRLLTLGDATAEEKRESITVADRALGRDLLTPDRADDLRVTRAITISELPDVNLKLRDDAIRVFEQQAERLRTVGDKERLRINLLGVSLLYQRGGRPEDAVRALTEAAELARRELARAGSADLLAEHGEQYQIIFETLAAALAECGRGREAVAAYETLRGAVPRLANDEGLRTTTAVRAAIQMLEGIVVSETDKTPDDEIIDPLKYPPPDVDRDFHKIQGRLLDTQTVLVYYGWVRERITALLVHSDPEGQISVDPVQWPFTTDWKPAVDRELTRMLREGGDDVPPEWPSLFNAFVHSDPSPLRNARLIKASREAHKHLFAPIEDRLRALNTKRLAICTAGILNSVSFETISERKRPGWFLGSDFDVCYLPSLGVASNIAGYADKNGKSLLMIGYSGTDIPGVDQEIEEIRNAWLGECKILRGSGLNKRKALQELAREYDFIHFAGHGVFDHDDPLNSAFYFATPGAEESLSDAHRLTAADLLKVTLKNHPVVTLSACSSGITSGSAAHRLTGLTGSLLQSGARTIIASRWPVADEIALELMRHTYASIATGATPFAAFLAAQASLRTTRPLEEWGAFSYLGLP